MEARACGDARCLIVASGPSASAAAVGRFGSLPTIAVNDAWRISPSAWITYAADFEWWNTYSPAVRAGHPGRRATCDARCKTLLRPADHELEFYAVEKRQGLSKQKGILAAGGELGFSGAQAINLAYLEGFRTLILLGFDMGAKTHFFGDHPPGLNRDTPWAMMIKGFCGMAKALSDEGVRVINASPDSAIPYWPRKSVDEVLAAL